MKNIFKRALALTMIAALFAVSAFAAPAISGVSYNSTTGKLSATVSGYEAGKDATILILKKGATLATAGNDEIVYIDQLEADAEGKVTYEVPIKDRAAALSATSVNLYVGGENVAAAVEYKNTEGTLADINISGGGSTETYIVEFDKTATYATLEEAKAAVKVKKSSDSSYLATTEFTVEEASTSTNVYTFTVKVGTETVDTITDVTITPVVPGGKTGITGTVKRRALGTNYNAAPAALVIVANGTTIVGTAVTDSTGNFEIEVPAGTYRVIVRFGLLTSSSVTNYANTTFTNVTVTDGAMNTIVTEGKEFVAIEKRLAGDANDDGVVNSADLDAVSGALATK